MLKRFNSECYGTETTLQSIREKRAEKFVELKPKRGSKEYDEYFLKYNPGDKTNKKNKTIKTSKISGKTNKKKTKMNKTKKKWFNRLIF